MTNNYVLSLRQYNEKQVTSILVWAFQNLQVAFDFDTSLDTIKFEPDGHPYPEMIYFRDREDVTVMKLALGV